MYKMSNAVLLGNKEKHFLFSSGEHSNTHLQSATVFMNPINTASLAEEMALQIRCQLDNPCEIDAVIVPAIGPIVFGHEVAKILNIKALYSEKDKSGEFFLRHGFDYNFKHMNFVALEDVATTGNSLKQVIKLVQKKGGNVPVCGTVIDRSQKPIDFGRPFISLAKVDIPIYKPNDCPLCKAGSKAVKIK